MKKFLIVTIVAMSAWIYTNHENNFGPEIMVKAQQRCCTIGDDNGKREGILDATLKDDLLLPNLGLYDGWRSKIVAALAIIFGY